MKTFVMKIKNIKKDWYFVDATDKTLGRIATVLAYYLRGKHKVEYSPHIDNGDYIIVINAEKIRLTGKKYTDKIYYRHTGYIGGIKATSFKELFSRRPENVIRIAVKGMLPRNSLGRTFLRKLKIYSGNQHKHIAQKPKFLDI